MNNTITLRLRQMIVLGHCDYFNDNINDQNFESGSLVIGERQKLFDFFYWETLEDTIAKMDSRGYKPGSLGDLLDFWIKNPKRRWTARDGGITAPGSIGFVNGRKYAVCIEEGYEGKIFIGIRDAYLFSGFLLGVRK